MGRLAVLMNILTNLTRLNDYQPGQQPVLQTDYSEKFFNQTIDHFDYVNVNQTFKQRYVISEEYWCEGCPIFLYLGNEADIKMFVNNTGIMWENAKSFRAMVLFVEHRYYGKSIPFGKLDYHLDKIGYLSVDQVCYHFSGINKRPSN